MPMYDLIEHSDNYLKKCRSLQKYYRDEPALNGAGTITNSPGNSFSFKSKVKITGKTPAAGNTKDAEVTVSLKYLTKFQRTLGMSLINCEINLIYQLWHQLKSVFKISTN